MKQLIAKNSFPAMSKRDSFCLHHAKQKDLTMPLPPAASTCQETPAGGAVVYLHSACLGVIAGHGQQAGCKEGSRSS